MIAGVSLSISNPKSISSKSIADQLKFFNLPLHLAQVENTSCVETSVVHISIEQEAPP